MPDKTSKANTTELAKNEANHWRLIKKVIGFQFKLALDGIRDVLLSPISIGAAVLGLLTRPDDPEKYYRALLKFGMKSDRWINLFDSAEYMAEKLSPDEYISKIEDLVVREHNKRGVLQAVKNQTDNLIDRAQSNLDKKASYLKSSDVKRNDPKNNG